MVPLVLGYIVLKSSFKSKSYANKLGGIGFATGATIIVFFSHFAWFFDWWATKTGSSTAGLIFIFIPLYAIGGSLVLGLITSLIGVICDKTINVKKL